MIRAQYHFRQSARGLLAWDVRRLVRLSGALPVHRMAIASIAELDENLWYAQGGVAPTCRSVVEHSALILAADCAYPIILDAAGRVMDGMHRVCKALMQGLPDIACVQFLVDPEPDFVGREPGSLPYEEVDCPAPAPPPTTINAR